MNDLKSLESETRKLKKEMLTFKVNLSVSREKKTHLLRDFKKKIAQIKTQLSAVKHLG